MHHFTRFIRIFYAKQLRVDSNRVGGSNWVLYPIGQNIDSFSIASFRTYWSTHSFFTHTTTAISSTGLWCQIGDGFPREFPPPRAHYAGAACPWGGLRSAELTDTLLRRSVREVGEILEGTRPRSGITGTGLHLVKMVTLSSVLFEFFWSLSRVMSLPVTTAVVVMYYYFVILI